jgi:hypothetical protein
VKRNASWKPKIKDWSASKRGAGGRTAARPGADRRAGANLAARRIGVDLKKSLLTTRGVQRKKKEGET